jgi:protein-S-isoprenylcysteine O-methyltransferase Ste14
MSHTIEIPTARQRGSASLAKTLKALVGSGERIGLLVLPFLVVGLALNILRPELFSVGGPSTVLRVLSIGVLIPGVTIWAWSVTLILTRVPRHELITSGPYSLVKHPLYTGVAFLVLPWVGFLLNTWLGALLGIVLYTGSRVYSPEEERALSETFGAAWAEYCRNVRIPWL